MNCRILNLNTLAEAFVRLGIILMNEVVSLAIESAEASLVAGGGFPSCLIIQLGAIRIPVVAPVYAEHLFFDRVC